MHLVDETKPDAERALCSSLRDRGATLLQDALLTTDGTMTDLLELFADEEIEIEKVTPGLYAAECERPECGDEPGSVVRDVILRGKETGNRYIFAHSHLFPAVLSSAVQARLSATSDPIGKVLREYRIESFRQMEESADCSAIVRAVIELGKELGIAVVAEGVETEQQFQILKNLGCLQVQGYLLARPIPPREARDMIKRQWGGRHARAEVRRRGPGVLHAS